MKYLLSLLAGLVTLASLVRGQVFRLPDTSACQKSKLLFLWRRLNAWSAQLWSKLLYCNHRNQSNFNFLKTFQELSMRPDLASPIISLGVKLVGIPSWTGRGPGTTAGSSAWTPSASPPRLRMTGWRTSWGTMTLPTYGLEVESVTSRGVRGRTFSQQSGMVGTGPPRARGFLHQTGADSVTGVNLEELVSHNLTTESRGKEEVMKPVSPSSTTFTRWITLFYPLGWLTIFPNSIWGSCLDSFFCHGPMNLILDYTYLEFCWWNSEIEILKFATSICVRKYNAYILDPRIPIPKCIEYVSRCIKLELGSCHAKVIHFYSLSTCCMCAESLQDSIIVSKKIQAHFKLCLNHLVFLQNLSHFSYFSVDKE